MTNGQKNLPLSKNHIFWSSLILAFIFTYAGVEESLLVSFTNIAFNINFVINFVQAYFLIRLAYHLYFEKNLSFWKAILITLGTFYLLQLVQVAIIDYEIDDYTELYSITLPFGSFCILTFNVYYNLVKKQHQTKASLKEGIEPLWLDSISGRVKINEENILYAFLTEAHLRIHTSMGILKAFYSLKQLEELLVHKESFFRLNKQYLCRSVAITSYRSLPDGRLEITLPDGEKCIVSKNKASSFKKWLSES